MSRDFLARQICASEGWNFDLLPLDAADFVRLMGGVIFRDPGIPFQCDYLAAADARLVEGRAA